MWASVPEVTRGRNHSGQVKLLDKRVDTAFPNERLRQARKRRGWRHKDIVAGVERLEERLDQGNRNALGLSEKSVSRWERGEVDPTDFYKARLCLLYEDQRPEDLGWDGPPGLLAQIDQLRTRLPRLDTKLPGGQETADEMPPLQSDLRRATELSQLPPDIEDFTGRHEQVREMTDLLLSEHVFRGTAVVIVAISGKGGVGKTALALHTAHLVRQRFPDGQLYTNLRGVEAQALDPADVLAGFLRDLGVDGSDIPEHLEDRARMFRAVLGRRRLLVVLDNAADEAQVRPLLPGSPGCAVLITSRSRLSAISGAHIVALDEMAPDHARDLLCKIIGPERFMTDPRAAREVAELCCSLPLALRVAGARLASRPAWQLDWFAERLRDERHRLDMLKAGDLEVRATFALSYEGRPEREKQAFRMLGVIKAADFPAWNLAAMTGAELNEAEEIIERLVDAELLEVAGVDTTGLVRYRFHDLMRDFARECLAHAEALQVQREAVRRLSEEYIEMVGAASALIQLGGPQRWPVVRTPLAVDVAVRDPHAWFVSERACLLSMVAQAYEAGLWEQTWRLAGPLPVMFDWRADWRDWEDTHRWALEAAGNAGSTVGEATIRRSLGMLYRELGRFDEAIALLQESSRIFASVGDGHSEAVARRHLGDTYRYKGQLREAIDCFVASLDVFERLSDVRSAAGALNGMADAYRGLSRWSDADDCFRRCIAIYGTLDDRLEEARARVRFAMVYRDRSLNDDAERLLTESLEVFRGLGDRRWEARALRHLGVVHRNEGRRSEALECFDRCLPIFDEIADQRGVAVTLRNRGDAHRRAGNHHAAHLDLREALVRFDELGDSRWKARTQVSIADLLRHQQRWEQAEAVVLSALSVFRNIDDGPGQARALRELAMVLRDEGRWQDAAARFEESHRIFSHLGDDLWTARVLAGLATLHDLSGQDSASLRRSVAGICRRCGVSPDRQEICLAEW